MWFLLLLLTAASPLPTGEELLARSIDYHDPEGTWMSSAIHLLIQTGYADGRTRDRECWVDFSNVNYRDALVQDERQLEQSIRDGECTFRVDGRVTIDPDRLRELGLTCERAEQMRDYVSYLWGLPMKLRDPGTRLGPVERTRFEGHEVLDLTVTYAEGVGTDIWHMYIDETTGRLVGYAFYKDRAETQGEVIKLEGEIRVGTARIPQVRHWFMTADDSFLGTDTLTSGQVIDAASVLR